VFPNSPPFRWLVQALATRWDVSARPLPSAEGEEFWEQVKRLAFKHRVTGMLARQARLIPDLTPRPVQLWLTASSQVEAQKSELNRAQVIEILRALQSAGLSFLVLQGWGLLLRAYENDLSQRPTSDLDLFFPPAARAESLRALEGLGYYRYRTYPREGFTARYERVEFLRRDDSPVIVDSHYAFADLPMLWPRIGKQWFERRESLDLDRGVRLPVCAQADFLLYQAVHLFSHYREAGLFHYYDLALLARAPGLDWESFTAQALASGMPGPLTAILRRAETWWPGTLPPDVPVWLPAATRSSCAGITAACWRVDRRAAGRCCSRCSPCRALRS
jgi:hypothetical protein